jgi:hypothetical protein
MISEQKTGAVHLWMLDSVFFFFFPGKISPKRNFQNSKRKKKVILEVFSHQKLEN